MNCGIPQVENAISQSARNSAFFSRLSLFIFSESSKNKTEREYYAESFKLIHGNRTSGNDTYAEIKELARYKDNNMMWGKHTEAIRIREMYRQCNEVQSTLDRDKLIRAKNEICKKYC